MKEFLLYVKLNYWSLIISSLILAWLYGIGQQYLLLAVIVFNIATGYNNYRKNIDFETRLKAKGLTREDAANIQFVKKWEITRERGLWNYCITDGGFICGSGLSIVTSILTMLTLQKSLTTLFAEPEDMFRFIGLNFLSGVVLGIVIFRFKWNMNEKKNLNLTDSLNLHFSTVKKLF